MRHLPQISISIHVLIPTLTSNHLENSKGLAKTSEGEYYLGMTPLLGDQLATGWQYSKYSLTDFFPIKLIVFATFYTARLYFLHQ